MPKSYFELQEEIDKKIHRQNELEDEIVEIEREMSRKPFFRLCELKENCSMHKQINNGKR